MHTCVFLLLWVCENVCASLCITSEIQFISYYQRLYCLVCCFIGVILLKDSRTHISYLLDTIAALSLIPFESVLLLLGPNLSNLNGKTISSWKLVAKKSCFWQTYSCSQFFAIICVSACKSVLGMDFLYLHDLQIDLKQSNVIFHILFLLPLPPFSCPFFLPYCFLFPFCHSFFYLFHVLLAWLFSFCHFPSHLFLAKTKHPIGPPLFLRSCRLTQGSGQINLIF